MEYQKSRAGFIVKHKKRKQLSKQTQNDLSAQNCLAFDSSDKFIKKILVDNKWKVIPTQSKVFTLKWIYMPKSNTFSELSQNQRVNHFPHTHILTTKLGLKRTLTSERSTHMGWKGQYHGHFFPRSYDLSEQIDHFAIDFNRTAITNLVKKTMIAIQLQAASIFRQLSKNILAQQKIDHNYLQQARQLLNYDMLWQRNLYTLKSCKLRLNSNIFSSLICYLSLLFTLDTDLNQDNFSQRQLKLLVSYSLHNPPYCNLEQHFEGNKQLAKLPSLSALKLFFCLYKKCFERWSWFKADGLRNIWVVKTSDSSRGRSIFLIQSIEEAQSLNNGMRLIQKYIEDVWIYRPLQTQKQNSFMRKLENRKFDIRLWVLVKSFAPLQAYIYQEGYLRISQNKYQLLDISSQKSHLTNFSVNWSHLEDTEDSYLLLSDFYTFLDGNQIKSSSKLKREINKIITHTLYSAEILTNVGDQRCFELFGFDIILDGDLKPWLLECNMSPACKQRGVLRDVLQEMGQGLLSLVGLINKHPFQKKWQKITSPQYTTVDKPKYINKYSKENYVKDGYKSQNSIKPIIKCPSLPGQSMVPGQLSRVNSLFPAISSSFHSDSPFMIVGTKISKKSINKLDSYFVALTAIIKIQKFYRSQIKGKSNQHKCSLASLKLIEILAKITKKRKNKYFKYFYRLVKKHSKLSSI